MNFQNEFFGYATKHCGLSGLYLEKHLETSTASAASQLRGFTPSVMEERQLNVVQMDVFSRLMMDRIIFLGVGIDDYVANVIQAQLLFLDSIDPKRDVQMYINSPGGSVTAGMGIYDTMQYIISGCKHDLYFNGCFDGSCFIEFGSQRKAHLPAP